MTRKRESSHVLIVRGRQRKGKGGGGGIFIFDDYDLNSNHRIAYTMG